MLLRNIRLPARHRALFKVRTCTEKRKDLIKRYLERRGFEVILKEYKVLEKAMTLLKATYFSFGYGFQHTYNVAKHNTLVGYIYTI